MERIKVSDRNFDITRVTLGTWAIGGFMWGGTEEQRSIETIHTAFEKGITSLDTAPVYGFGKSEQIIGKAIQEYGNRENIQIATKVGLEWDENGKNIRRNSSRERILKEVEDSLLRLQTDYIDIYQVHWPDYRVDFEETAATLLELLENGKIRAIGVSNFSADQMKKFMKTAPIHVCQPPYNLFEREAEEEVIPFCKENNITLLTYGAICRGLLSGKMTPDQEFPRGDLRRNDPKFAERDRFKNYINAVKKLDEYAKNRFESEVMYLAVRWILDRGVDSAIWGARRPEQVTFDRISGFELTETDFGKIDQILSETIEAEVGPEFMAPPK